MISQPPTVDELRAPFERHSGLTVGVEEEAMLLDAATLDLAPRAEELVTAAADDRFKLELPASQVEIVLPPRETVGELANDLAGARRVLADRARDRGLRPAAAGVHPFADGVGELSSGERYERILVEYGEVARRQLVCSLQVHVAVAGADRALAVHNALRSYLPELAALAANAPFHEGRDSGMASVRPRIAEALPRQGVPPALESWERYAEALRWGAAAGPVSDPRMWWWELRPNPAFGTLELRVPDAQSTVAEAGAVAGFAHALVAWLCGRHDAGERLSVHPRWRIEENRWAAARHGLDGQLADLRSGERRPARARLSDLIDELEPCAERLGCDAQLAAARELAAENGAIRQRRVAAETGIGRVAAWLAGRYLSPDG